MFDPEEDFSFIERTGLDIQWTANGTLEFGDSIMIEESYARSLAQLRAVARFPESCTPAESIQYWLYNNVNRRRDRERIMASGLRHQLTLLTPNAIGMERSKTFGHRHNRPTNSTLDYPEICEVLAGDAWFVFQLLDEAERSASFCGVRAAKAGEKIIIPPNLVHLVINAGAEPLLISRVIPMALKSIYQPLATMRGAAWLNTIDNGWVKNPTYRTVADLTWWSSFDAPDMGLTPEKSLYRTLIQSPESLLWLLEPASFPDVFPDLWDGISKLVDPTDFQDKT